MITLSSSVRYFDEILDGTDFVLSELEKSPGKEYKDGYLFVTMGAGDNWKIGKEVLEIAEKAEKNQRERS